MIVYLCSETCSLDKKDQTDLTYILNISYPWYKIDHQNEKIPLERNSDKYPFYKEFFFSYSKSSLYQINWGIIKYKEERGLLGFFDNLFNEKKIFNCLDISSIEQINTEGPIELGNKDDSLYKFKILTIISMKIDNNQYIEYIRTKKSFLDVLANIGALFSALCSILNFIFYFYSRNFNNYKIIKEILSRLKEDILNNNLKIPRSKTIKFENINRKNINILNNDNQSFDTSKSVPFKSKGINIANKIKIKKNFMFINNEFNFYKINFMQFLLDNIYCKRKKRRN